MPSSLFSTLSTRSYTYRASTPSASRSVMVHRSPSQLPMRQAEGARTTIADRHPFLSCFDLNGVR